MYLEADISFVYVFTECMTRELHHKIQKTTTIYTQLPFNLIFWEIKLDQFVFSGVTEDKDDPECTRFGNAAVLSFFQR